jgi:crotonobetainyl-CoA:carnitine CoA-transferase CaiB-like acyl-CoA transferase
MTATITPSGLLAGIRILEIGQSDTIHIAGMLLADHGAEIIRVDAGRTGTNDTAFHRITDRSKQSFLFDPGSREHAASIKKLAGGADILLEDADSRLEPIFHLSTTDVAGLIRCTVVPTDEPDITGAWTEETVSAQVGLYQDGLSIGAPPRFYDLPITATLGALYTINAVVRMLIGRQRFDAVDAVRVPLDRISSFAQSLTIMIRSNPPTSWEPFRWVASPFWCTWRTAGGGCVYFHIGMPRHLRSFLFFLEKIGYKNEKARIKKYLHAETKRDPVQMQSVGQALSITRVLQKLFLEKTADEWEEILGNAGFCCTKIRSFHEWCCHPQITKTNQILTCLDADGTMLRVPGPLFDSPYLPATTGGPNRSGALTPEACRTAWPRRGEAPAGVATRPPLEGIRVLDIGRVIAGPFAGRLLAEAGADVLHVSLRHNHLGWEEPFNIIYNQGKKSVAVDFTRPEGRAGFQKLVAWYKPDVIIHNFMDDAAKKIGCDYETCRKSNEKVICLDFKGYARGGPWADHPGFEQNVQAASGILGTFCGTSTPRILPVPMNDLGAGLIGSFAVLLALLNRDTVQRGDHLTAYIATPSILVHLHYISDAAARERKKKFYHYFKASDGWFLLSAARDDLGQLTKIPQVARYAISGGGADTDCLSRAFRREKIGWWISEIKAIGAQETIVITPHRSLSAVLKKELRRRNPLFSYRFHEGFGNVVCTRPPLAPVQGNGAELSPAPYPGLHNEQVLRKAGIDPAPHLVPIPSIDTRISPMRERLKRIGWFLKQAKWLAVIAYRNRGMR